MWHDHATGLRSLRLAKLFAIGSSCRFISKQEADDLVEVINSHNVTLSKESFYSKGTNHGFDQSVSAYAVCLLMEAKGWGFSSLREVFCDRILSELDFAFTDEGVHVENSPSYQVYMLSKEKVLNDLELIGDQCIKDVSGKIFEKARLFLSALTKSDGTLPPIGDTQFGEKGACKSTLKYGAYNYSKSGYYVYKSLEGVYLIIKNSHLSSYHRHDDNGSFFLEINGVTVFGDGGLGFYKEKDARRKFLRSTYAHNVIFSSDGKLSRVPKTGSYNSNSMEVFGDLVVCCFSDSKNNFKRVFDVSRIKEGKILIFDFWQGDGEPVVNFFIPHEDSITLSKDRGGVYFQGDGVFVDVKIHGGVAEVPSRESFGKEYAPCFSPKYSKFAKCSNVFVKKKSSSPGFLFEISW